MTDRLDFYMPTGRFVSGSLTQKRTKDNRNQPIPEKDQQYSFGIAIRKDDPGMAELWGNLINGSKTLYQSNPTAQQCIDRWAQTFQGFSMKVKDGDAPNAQGKLNENTQGCLVVYFSSDYPSTCYSLQNLQIDPAEIEKGYYVQPNVNIRANNQTASDRIGIYMNCNFLRFVGKGAVIATGMDHTEALAAAPAPQLPPGALPVDAVPQAPAMPGVPGMAPLAAPTPTVPMAPPAAPMAPPAPPAPPAGVPGVPPTPAPQVGNGPPTGTGYPTNPPFPGFVQQ